MKVVNEKRAKLMERKHVESFLKGVRRTFEKA